MRRTFLCQCPLFRPRYSTYRYAARKTHRASPWRSPLLVLSRSPPSPLRRLAVKNNATIRSVKRRGAARCGALFCPAAPRLLHRRAERFEQFAIDRIAVGAVLGVPLYAERKARRVGDADRLDRIVLGNTLDHDALARLQDALAVQRINPDGVAAEQFCEHAAGRQPHVVAI